MPSYFPNQSLFTFNVFILCKFQYSQSHIARYFDDKITFKMARVARRSPLMIWSECFERSLYVYNFAPRTHQHGHGRLWRRLSWFAEGIFFDSCAVTSAHYVSKWKAFGTDKAKVLDNSAYQGCLPGTKVFLCDCDKAREVIPQMMRVNQQLYFRDRII